MSLSRTEAVQIVFSAIEEFNSTSPKMKIEKEESTILYSLGGSLDSIGLISLAIEVEQKLAEVDIIVSLATSHAFSLSRSPFKTVDSLIEYVQQLSLHPIVKK